MNIPKLLVLLIALLLCLNTEGQTIPQWQWATIAKDSSDCHIFDIATDAEGNVYVTGSFKDTLMFPADTLASRGNSDIFWAKYSPAGQFLWAGSAGGSDADQGTGIAIDGSGNVYVSSTFYDTISFGNDTFIARGLSDLALCKYDKNGTKIWAHTWGSVYPDESSKLCIDKNNNIFYIGVFADDGASPPSYGSITFGNFTFASNGGGDIFLVKLDSNAVPLWATHAGGKFGDGPSDVAVDSLGYIYLTGYFDAPWADFVNKRVYSKNGPFNDMFIAQYDSTGYPLWVRGAGGDYPTAGAGLAVDAMGNSYIAGAGAVASPIKFDNNIVLNDARSFIVKYSFTGDLLWAHKVYISSNGYNSDITIDNENNIYTTGFFSPTMVFGGDTINVPGSDIFVNKYNNNGDPIWTREPQGIGATRGAAITLDKDHNVLVGGTDGATENFDAYNVSPDVTSILIARLAGTTGLQDINASSANALVYPIPAANVVHIRANSDYNDLQLCDILGHVIYQQPLSRSETLVDVNMLTNGVYYLQLSGKKSRITRKITVCHF